MKATLLLRTSLFLSACLLAGCENMPGRPHAGPEVERPESLASFQPLYQQNCSGCHGANGQKGPATNLSNPVYQAIVDDATLRDIIAKGQPGTLMPAFGKQAGGFLTENQIEILVRGLRSSWAKGNLLQGQNPPPYKADAPGDPAHGQMVYTSVCAQCHGTAAKPGKNGSVLDGSFLGLVSEQTIRTTVIAGRPDLGMPDWRGLVKDQPLTNREVNDVVAWVMSQKPQRPGQPYPQTSDRPTSLKGGE